MESCFYMYSIQTKYGTLTWNTIQEIIDALYVLIKFDTIKAEIFQQSIVY